MNLLNLADIAPSHDSGNPIADSGNPVAVILVVTGVVIGVFALILLARSRRK